MGGRQAALFGRADYLLTRRLQDYAERGQLAAATSAFGAFVTCVIRLGGNGVLAQFAWLGFMLAVSLARVEVVRRFTPETIDLEYFRRQRRYMVGLGVADSLGWGVGIYMFAIFAQGAEHYLLSVLAAGVITASMIYYRAMPQVCVIFVAVISLTGFAVSYALLGGIELVSASLIVALTLVLMRGISDDARLYRRKFEGEAELAESAETIQLLLHDYEAQSADWLWQVDKGACLVSVCDRFGEAAGCDPQDLEGRELVSLFDTGPARELLAHRLLVRQPFRDLSISLNVDGETRWWSLSANCWDDGTMHGVARDTTDTRQAVERMNFMAHHDMLTGIANRFLFGETLREVLERKQTKGRQALLYLDLDHFKQINDTWGHSTGDRLLTEAAKRIGESVKSHDLVARLGGDEFAVLLTRLTDATDAAHVAQRIVSAMEQPFVIDDQKLSTGTSVGIAHVQPCREGVRTCPDDLLRQADLALYAAKALGRGTFAEFEPWLEERDRERAQLEADLKTAIQNDEFTLHYQPLYDVAQRKTVGFETLVRWQSPVWGVVMPGEFIPLAEDSGLIVALGEWIIRNAIHEAAGWPDKERVAINLSPLQMRSPRLLPTITEAIRATKIDPGRIELEITENMLMHDSERNVAMLHEFRNLGMRIALDDFGTGYSSLNYLRSFPFDKIKIDKCFVEEIEMREDCQAIVRAITQLAGALGMSTVAEGVERESQLDWLRAEGITQIQGYLISYPVNANELCDGRPFNEDRHKWFKPPDESHGTISDAA
ncbi:putative bifunctional diguanylate cyclase/phosphodiesterase [Croceicoccus bisphenolivorans]|uniref:putative bifunctional diguanylate cyclase/phosphodiesterase n=1 Tax=Croceicoccus bisphenolivorans TaxID=1783232 RepID=UPI00082FECC5|nr:EAL domain-containing protein [Croceicoccus bisphenolivorans]